MVDTLALLKSRDFDLEALDFLRARFEVAGRLREKEKSHLISRADETNPEIPRALYESLGRKMLVAAAETEDWALLNACLKLRDKELVKEDIWGNQIEEIIVSASKKIFFHRSSRPFSNFWEESHSAVEEREFIFLLSNGPVGYWYLTQLAKARVNPKVLIDVRLEKASRRLLTPREWATFSRLVDDTEINAYLSSMGLHLDKSRLVRRFVNRISTFKHFGSGINDIPIRDKIQESGLTWALFSGGGRVSKPLLENGVARFLHIHPGILPNQKGADGLLWSVLNNGCVGMSAFAMAPEIDAGAVFLNREFPLPRRPLPLEKLLNPKQAYKFVLDVLDPAYRSAALRACLLSGFPSGAFSGEGVSQVNLAQKGRYFSFMHPRIRDIAIEALMRVSRI